MEKYFGDPFATAHIIKDRIKKELGFTVNIGISTNKLLAKMACEFEKPDKVHTLWPDEIPSKLWPLPIGDLYMVGHRMEDPAVFSGLMRALKTGLTYMTLFSGSYPACALCPRYSAA